MNLLAKHMEALSSLGGVPDVLRNKLRNILCNSRRMDSCFMELLTSGSPTEIRVKDGSWLTKEEFSKIIKGYITFTMFCKSGSLHASKFSSIKYMDVLGSVLKELYLVDCQNIDMMLSLPALQKLDFASNFVTRCGRNLKELDFSGCSKLTDKSLKAVGENCSAFETLHLDKLHKLTDFSLGYLANGYREPLTEFSLKKVKKILQQYIMFCRPTYNYLLARCCSKNLLSLDISWCRSLTDSALGLIVTSNFLNGHTCKEKV
ncbi:hypothetical protein MKX01_034752 [Papaver californicum]|nr:hypothetical protein MKX01_034752 [Papaver californicum]